MMSKWIGQKFHQLTVIEVVSRGSAATVRVRCDCGTERVLSKKNIGKQKSCGCYKSKGCLRHGHAHEGRMSPVYRSWKSMMQRCNDPNSIQWADYGGRGITVCKAWFNFEAFLRDAGEPSSAGMSIDRIKNDRGYEPGNVKWSTRSEQCRNRRTNRIIEFNGQRKCLAEWSETTGIGAETLAKRIEAGWSIEEALTTKVRRCVRRAA